MIFDVVPYVRMTAVHLFDGMIWINQSTLNNTSEKSQCWHCLKEMPIKSTIKSIIPAFTRTFKSFSRIYYTYGWNPFCPVQNVNAFPLYKESEAADCMHLRDVFAAAAVDLIADRMSLQVSAGHQELNTVKWMLSESRWKMSVLLNVHTGSRNKSALFRCW